MGREPGGPSPHSGPVGVGRRLECLQRIVSKLQMEAGLCEEQLNQADALLQSVRGGGRAVGRRVPAAVGREDPPGCLARLARPAESRLLPPGVQPA